MGTSLKQALKTALVVELTKRLDAVHRSLERAQETAQEESKSSAGDKYETNLAMVQRDIEQFSVQYQVVEKELTRVQLLDVKQELTAVGQGAVVRTSLGSFYISLGGEDIEVEDEEFTPISLSSPVGQAIAHAQAGESRQFRGSAVKILSVE